MTAETRDVQPGRVVLAATLAAALALAGCSSFSPDGGLSRVQALARPHLGQDLLWARSDAERTQIDQRVAGLLAKPLDVDDAVQLALLNNRGLQAAYAELGITEAELVQAGRLPNPGFSLARLRRGGELELERGLHFDLARLLALPWVLQLEQRRFEQAGLQVAMAALSLAADTRKAWIQAVAAVETRRYTQQVMQAAEASAELARRMQQAGNFSPLQRAREQGFYAEAALQLARAEQQERSTRERLTRLLGLWGAQTQFSLPQRLPELPRTLEPQPDIESLALAQRLDVQRAKLAAEHSARQLGLTRATRFVNVLELGALRSTSNEAPTQRGWEIGVELPLFDWGDARLKRSEAVYMQALHHAARTAIDARSEVREAYGNYHAAHAIARHQFDELVPLRQRIAEQNLLRYNGMLIGVFELLADTRAQIISVNAAIDALRDFWLAQADLELAMTGRPGLAPAAGPSAPAQADGAGH